MKLWDLSGCSEKSNIQEAYLPKTSISGQIVSEILAQLCSDDSMQILLRACLHGVGDPGLVGLVSFVFTL